MTEAGAEREAEIRERWAFPVWWSFPGGRERDALPVALDDILWLENALTAERLAHARVRAAGARLTERWATVSSAGMICYHCGEAAEYHDAVFAPRHAETCPIVAWEAALAAGSWEAGE